MPGTPVNIVVFDAVGTLIRPVESISAVYLRHATALGSELNQQTVKFRFSDARSRLFDNHPDQPSSDEIEKRSWRMLVEDVFRELHDHDELFNQLWEYYAQPENWMVFPEVPRCLERLGQQQFRTAIASNFDSRLIKICELLPPLGKITNVFCSGLVGYRKPDVRFFRNVERLLGVSSIHKTASLVMVGDDFEKDVRAARTAGWNARHIDRSKTVSASLLDLDWDSLR